MTTCCHYFMVPWSWCCTCCEALFDTILEGELVQMPLLLFHIPQLPYQELCTYSVTEGELADSLLCCFLAITCFHSSTFKLQPLCRTSSLLRRAWTSWSASRRDREGDQRVGAHLLWRQAGRVGNVHLEKALGRPHCSLLIFKVSLWES